MTKKRIFLHIGTHKTATTTIQKGCCENKAALLEAGWLYPETGMYLFGQHNIAWEMASGNAQPWNHVNYWVRYRSEWGGITDLIAEIESSPAQNVILSSEDFDGLQPERIQLLREHLQFYDVEVIVYLRKQASFLQSAWAQFMKSGYISDDFPTFIDRKIGSTDEALRCFGAYDVFLRPWMDVFGAEHVHPKPFSRDAFKGHVFHDFLATCGVSDVERFMIPANQNISPGYKTLEMIRLMGQDVDLMERRSLVTRFLQHYAREKEWNTGKLNLINAELHERIQNRFSASNHFLNTTFKNGQPFFLEVFSEKPLSTFSIDEMSGEEWEEITRAMVVYFINQDFVSVNQRRKWK